MNDETNDELKKNYNNFIYILYGKNLDENENNWLPCNFGYDYSDI